MNIGEPTKVGHFTNFMFPEIEDPVCQLHPLFEQVLIWGNVERFFKRSEEMKLRQAH